MNALSHLTIVFIVLKLTHYIDWSWFYVLAPTLLPIGIGFGMIPVGILLSGKGTVNRKIK